MGEVAEAADRNSGLIFAINGERFDLDLSSVDPSTTLLEFLRSSTRFKSVKLSCGEGGCGACAVLVSKYDPVLKRVDDFHISSCLTLLCSINKCSITTSEGLGNSKTGFHPIHQRIAGFHATQCGFCTPGMCVSLYSALLNAQKSNPSSKNLSLTAAEAEKAIAGNLCRCTGYRPIADACKSFASDVDIEDLGFNSFWKKGESKDERIKSLPAYDRTHQNAFPEFLVEEVKKYPIVDPTRNRWITPVSIPELQSLLNAYGADNKGGLVKLIAGNTSTGYYKEEKNREYEKYIDLKGIPELSEITRNRNAIKIGAAVTISKVIEALKEKIDDLDASSSAVAMFEKLAVHMEKVANRFVRNSGSIGGNLVMAQKKQFPSDIATILLPLGVTVEVIDSCERQTLMLEELLDRPPLDPDVVVISLEIPFWSPTVTVDSVGGKTELMFETYRAAPRPLGSALAFLNAAFLAEVSPSKTLDGVVINVCRLAFGAFGTDHAIRARKVEEFLTGKVLTFAVLQEAVGILKTVIVPNDTTSNSAYRSSLAVGFLFDFFYYVMEIGVQASVNGVDGHKNCLQSKQSETLEITCGNDQRKSTAMLSSAQQVIEGTEYSPVGKPVIKSGASLQASGEAVYVDDIPSPPDCLYGAFIYSTKPLARVKGITLSQNSASNNVYRIITFKDIPENGKNLGAKATFCSEPLFADELTRCAGDRIALVVADSQKNADIAASLAVVDYDTENLEPILSIEDAVEKSSLFEIPPFSQPKPIGDTSKGMVEADHKITGSKIKLGSQYFFYMETQAALAMPDEDNCIVVYSSTQNPEYVHWTVAGCLGLPENNVRVITRRVGGGFGGKAIKSMPVATACALAAHKLQRPVRTYMNRKSDMIMTGGRHPMKITYNVGFKSTGKITALELELLIDAGIYGDLSPMMPQLIYGTLKKYNWGSLSVDAKVCKTNLPSRTAMRGPGEVQGTYIAEAIIEHVASSLSIEPDEIRKINFHTHESLELFYEGCAGEPPEYTLPLIWDKLGVTSGFNQRVENVKQFNLSNKFQKRGISRVPIIYDVSQQRIPGKVSILSDGSVVVEVGGIEIGQGLWTKVKQMAAYGLGSVQCDGGADILLEKVRVVQSDTLSLVQGGLTAGSTTSESSCEAVRICCGVLVERLMEVKNAVVEMNPAGPVTWEMLIRQAYLQSVNMSASALYKPEFATARYLNYGAAVSEVEIDLLTGQTTTLRTDIIYDCGKSLNPAVDLGQIEGAFVQGLGFFMLEEFVTNSDGLIVTDSTWTYKIPTLDTIPRQFNVEIVNSGHHKNRVLSSKASGEPPLLLAASVHCATRAAIKEAQKQLQAWSGLDDLDRTVHLPVPATMPVVKELSGLDIAERYLDWRIKKTPNCA